MFGTNQEAIAAEVNTEDSSTNLPEGVEVYNPENPLKLIEFYTTDAQRFISTYSANSAAKYVELTSNEQTDTTSRILVDYINANHAGLHLNLNINKFGPRGTMVYTLFKNGSYYRSYVAYNTEDIYHSVNLLHGEYSLRLYCGNPDELETGCSADATISVFWQSPF